MVLFCLLSYSDTYYFAHLVYIGESELVLAKWTVSATLVYLLNLLPILQQLQLYIPFYNLLFMSFSLGSSVPFLHQLKATKRLHMIDQVHDLCKTQSKSDKARHIIER